MSDQSKTCGPAPAQLLFFGVSGHVHVVTRQPSDRLEVLQASRGLDIIVLRRYEDVLKHCSGKVS